MKFSCETCNYSTDVKFCYQKHLSSKRHQLKVQKDTISTIQHTSDIPSTNLQQSNIKMNKCMYCNEIFSNSSSLTRHKKICPEKDNNETKYKHEIELLNAKVQELNKLYEKEKQTSQTLEKDNKYLKTLVNGAGNIIKTSVSTLNYITTNYANAPVLKALNDYSVIEHDDNNDEFNLIDALIIQHDIGTLDKYIGDFIVKTYKKEDPSQQSIWNSDTTRLTYVIREIINKNPGWKSDKKGVSTKKYIIDPLLKYIDQIVSDYMQTASDDLADNIHEMEWQLKERTDKINSAAKIHYNIINKFLAVNILKYIAPHFYVNKNDQLIEN